MKTKNLILIIILLFVGFLIFTTIFYDNTKKLSGGYTYYPDNHHILGKIDIPPDVISYNYNKDFIIVKQSPTEIQDAIYDKMNYNYENGRNNIYYWLIIHQQELVLGPMDSITYEKARIKYEVPGILKLK